MITPELQNYINQARAQGMTDAQIRQNLLTGGWNEADLAQAGLASSFTSPQTLAHPTTTPGVYIEKKKTKAGLYIVVFLIFFALGAFGSYAYYNNFLPFQILN